MPGKNLLCSNIAENCSLNIILVSVLMLMNLSMYNCMQSDIWEKVPCNVEYQPDNCDFDKIPLLTVDDFYRCGPANLNVSARQYFLGASGERITYNENKKAYKRLRIIPTYLRDVSKRSLETKALGQNVSFPIGLSPVALHKYAHPEGERATIQAISDLGIVMILSSYASISIEEAALYKGSSHLWMHTVIYRNRSFIMDIVSRAERWGYEAIVISIDYPQSGTLTCNSRGVDSLDGVELAIFPGHAHLEELTDNSATFETITWLKSITKLPIVAKGVLTASDARKALLAGASAIFVSNHGGRQLDSAPASIDMLSEVVDAVNEISPGTDVYVDGGIRTGQDVYKAIAMGAKMAFIGRPTIWGLAKEGESGVKKVLSILKSELEETMVISGAAHPSEITRDRVKAAPSYC